MCHDTTKLLLGIADENLKITDGETGEDGVIRLTGHLDYTPKACPKCGIINDQKSINYGWRNTTIRFSKVLSNTVILALKRRYFHCKECHGNFLAQTVAVPKHCTISNTSRKETHLMSVEAFIGALIRHIPDRHFKTIRRYGIYSQRIKTLMKQVMAVYQKAVRRRLVELKQVMRVKSWTEKTVEVFGMIP